MTTCEICGVELPKRRGRPRRSCDAHTPSATASKRVWYVANRERLVAEESARNKRKRAARRSAETI